VAAWLAAPAMATGFAGTRAAVAATPGTAGRVAAASAPVPTRAPVAAAPLPSPADLVQAGDPYVPPALRITPVERSPEGVALEALVRRKIAERRADPWR